MGSSGGLWGVVGNYRKCSESWGIVEIESDKGRE